MNRSIDDGWLNKAREFDGHRGPDRFLEPCAMDRRRLLKLHEQMSQLLVDAVNGKTAEPDWRVRAQDILRVGL
jgi:hypothetical protein